RVAVLRSRPGTTFDARAHNALWVIDADGTPRRLYEPKEPSAFVFYLAWSPDGRWLTVWEQPIVSNSVTADGDRLPLVDATNGGVYVAGTGPGARYSVRSDDPRSAAQRLPGSQIVEGLRPSADAGVTLVLVRRPTAPGRDGYGALELWLMTSPSGGASAPVRL